MTRQTFAAALAVAAVVPAAAAASDTNVAVTNTAIVEAHTDNGDGDYQDDHYGIGINRLNVTGNAGDLSAQLRVDAFATVDLCPERMYRFAPADRDSDGRADYQAGTGEVPRPGVDRDGDGRPDALDLDLDGVADRLPRCVDVGIGPEDPYRSDVVLERMQLSYRRGDFTLTAGDTYQQLGRGIVLALRKVDEAGLDASLQGGAVEVRRPGAHARAFAGRVNPANLDSVNQNAVAPIDDVVIGHAVELRAIDGLRLSTFGAYLGRGDRVVPGQEFRDWNYAQGISLELPSPTDGVSVYLEGDAQTRALGRTRFTGLAAYATVSLAARDFSATLEGIALDDFSQLGSGNSALSGAAFRHNQAPTLERNDQETLNAPAVLGGRARLEEYLFGAGTTLFLNGMLLSNNRGTAGELRQLHGYAGFKTDYAAGRSRVGASGGYRDETNTRLASTEYAYGTYHPGDRQLKSMVHADADWLHALGGGFALHVATANELRTLNDVRSERGTTLAGLDRAGLGGVTFELGYDTQNPDPRVRSLFFAGVVKWEVTPAVTLTATGGTQRGGIKCINGVCREYPAFAGARAELVARF